MNVLKAVIFDQDGTLVNTEPVISIVYTKLLKNHGVLPIANPDGMVHPIGVRSDKVLHYFSERYLLKMDLDKFKKEKNKLLFKYMKTENIELMPGVLNLLKKLRTSKIKIVLATGSNLRLVNSFMKKFKIRKYFDIIITGEDFKKSKPSPEVYILALKKLGISCKSCVAVEDSNAGIESASLAKIKVLAVGPADANDKKHPLVVIRTASLNNIDIDYLRKIILK